MSDLDQLARQEANRYAREWRARNPDKKAAANRRYWQKRALKRLEQQQEGARNERS